MVQVRSASRSIIGSPYAYARPIVGGMAKKKPSDQVPDATPERSVDPHVLEIARRLGELRERSGLSRIA